MAHTTTIRRGRPQGERKTRKWPMPPPSAALNLTMTKRPDNHPCHRHPLQQSSRWQKDQKMVHATTIHRDNLTVTERPENGPCHRHPPQKTSRWERPEIGPCHCYPSWELMVTEKPENGPCHCHLQWQTSRWQKDQKMAHVCAIRRVKPHNDRKTRKWSMPPPSIVTTSQWQKDQKMVHATAIHRRRPHGERDQKLAHAIATPGELMMTKHQKMVHATAICSGRLHGDRKTRKWSMSLTSSAADFMVTERPENVACHHHPLRQTSRWQKDQKMRHVWHGMEMVCPQTRKWCIPLPFALAVLNGDRKTRKWSMTPPFAVADLTVTERRENGPWHRHPPQETSRWQKDQNMVHATAIHRYRPHGDRKTRKWSMPLLSARVLTVTDRP